MPPIGLLAGADSSRDPSAAAGGDQPGFAEVMIKNREVVKAHRAIGQLEVVHRAGAQTGFDKVFQVVPQYPKQPPNGNGRSISSINSYRASNCSSTFHGLPY